MKVILTKDPMLVEPLKTSFPEAIVFVSMETKEVIETYEV
jgi:hypothetical protein